MAKPTRPSNSRTSSSRRHHNANLPTEESWRLVEGEHDSFEATMLPSLPSSSSDDILRHLSDAPSFSGSLSFSQGSSSSQQHQQQQGTHGYGYVHGQGQGGSGSGGHSQDSIRDFAAHGEDDNVILREPFRPSLLSSRAGSSARFSTATGATGATVTGPELRMPVIDLGTAYDGSRTGSSRGSSRTLGRDGSLGGAGTGGLKRRFKALARFSDRDEDGDDHGASAQRYGHDRHRRGQVRHPSRWLTMLPGPLNDIITRFLHLLISAFRYVQRPLTIILSAYLLIGTTIFLQSALTSTPLLALSPVCRIPLMSTLHLPFCPTNSPSDLATVGDTTTEGTSQHQALSFEDLIDAEIDLEPILSQSVDAASLPHDLLRSSRAVGTLRGVVRDSDLPSKEALLPHFDAYDKEVSETVRRLVRFNAGIGPAIDSIQAINHRTSRSLRSLVASSGSHGSNPAYSIFTTWLASLFDPFRPPPQILTEQVLRAQYITLASHLSDRLDDLLSDAHDIQSSFANTDHHISSIYVLANPPPTEVTSRSLILHYVATLLRSMPFNQDKLTRELAQLGRVENQRAQAARQLQETIDRLDQVRTKIEGLRNGVAAMDSPALTNRRAEFVVPVSVHVDAIEKGIQRLAEARKNMQDGTYDMGSSNMRRWHAHDDNDDLDI